MPIRCDKCEVPFEEDNPALLVSCGHTYCQRCFEAFTAKATPPVCVFCLETVSSHVVNSALMDLAAPGPHCIASSAACSDSGPFNRDGDDNDADPLSPVDGKVSPSPAPAACPTHAGVPLDLYCLTCHLHLCGHCVAFSHRKEDHDIRTRSGATLELSAHVSLEVDKYRDACRVVLGKAQEVTAAKTALRERAAVAKSTVRAFLGSVRRVVDVLESKVIETVEGVEAERVKDFDAETDVWVVTASQLGGCVELCENALSADEIHTLRRAAKLLESSHRLLRSDRAVLTDGSLDVECDASRLPGMFEGLVKVRHAVRFVVCVCWNLAF